MAHEELIAELKKGIAMLEDSLAYWQKQPDSQGGSMRVRAWGSAVAVSAIAR